MVMRIKAMYDLSKIEKKQLFLWAYFLMMLGLLLSTTDFMPMTSLFAKLKYLFIVVCIGDILSNRGKIDKIDKSVFTVILIVLFHNLLFGNFVVNDIVKQETSDHCIMTMLYIIILFLIYYEVKHYNCYIEFLKYSYVSLTCVVFILFFSHLWQVVWNPLFIIRTFFGVRITMNFGFGHSNYVGLLCFVIFTLSYFLLMEMKKSNILDKNGFFIIYMIVGNIITYLMFNSASSRSPILSMFIMVTIILLYAIINKWFTKSKKQSFILMVICILIIIVIMNLLGFWSYLWNNSNRQLNIEINYPIFQELGNFWTGMGWVENGGFQTNVSNNFTSVFGVRTSSLDMYYVFIFFTTGFIGCVLIGVALLSILVSLIKKSTDLLGVSYLAFFVALLVYSFFETILFTYKLWQMMIPLTMIFWRMGIREDENSIQIDCQ